MYNKLIVEPINDHCICEMLKLWENHFSEFSYRSEIFSYWKDNEASIFNFIKSHARNERGVIAKLDGEVVGYLVYDDFNFHGEHSAFIPYAANAASIDNRYYIYLAMYRELSKIWVKNGIKNHYITINDADSEVKNALFDVGFGSYLIDAFSKPEQVTVTLDEKISIDIAEQENIDELYKLVKESEEYYAESPIFLKRELVSLGELKKLINNNKVFIAKDEEKIIGFLNLTIADSNDILGMSVKGFGQIDEIGAYIKKEYRNKNIGTRLISKVFEYSLQTQVPCIHVDFETANMYGNKFWKKYFVPTLLSLKRTVHSDV